MPDSKNNMRAGAPLHAAHEMAHVVAQQMTQAAQLAHQEQQLQQQQQSQQQQQPGAQAAALPPPHLFVSLHRYLEHLNANLGSLPHALPSRSHPSRTPRPSWAACLKNQRL